MACPTPRKKWSRPERKPHPGRGKAVHIERSTEDVTNHHHRSLRIDSSRRQNVYSTNRNTQRNCRVTAGRTQRLSAVAPHPRAGCVQTAAALPARRSWRIEHVACPLHDERTGKI